MILKSGGNIMQYGNYALDFQGGDPYNPLNLPPFTIRCKFSPGYTPTAGDSQTLVDAEENVWDITNNSTNWNSLFSLISNLIEVLGANTTGVTIMANMFYGCTSLTSLAIFDTSSVTSMLWMFNSCTSLTTVPLFDTSSVTSMESMFAYCTSLTSVPLFDTRACTDMSLMFQRCTNLTSVPLFDTSKVTKMISVFYYCTNVQTGALALYQQASTQANPPGNHYRCFYNCGVYTVTGAAELAQIPDDWK